MKSNLLLLRLRFCHCKGTHIWSRFLILRLIGVMNCWYLWLRIDWRESWRRNRSWNHIVRSYDWLLLFWCLNIVWKKTIISFSLLSSSFYFNLFKLEVGLCECRDCCIRTHVLKLLWLPFDSFNHLKNESFPLRKLSFCDRWIR